MAKDIRNQSAEKQQEKKEIEAELEFLIRAMEEASSLALQYWKQGVKAQIKTDFHSIRTEADMAVGDFLKTSLKSLYPSFTIIEEETGGIESPNLLTIDPIDGTNVFERGMEDWCLSVAKIVNGQPVAGLISAPARRVPEMYVAYAEYGAYMNGEPITVSEIKRMQEGTITVGQRNIRRDEDGSIRRLTGQFRRLWVPGSTSLALANIARGRIDVVIAQGQPVWDVAPGFALVREAGGRATLWNGKEELDTSGNSTNDILVSNGLLHEQVRRQLSSVSV
jgi:myo-inositol-1(or 4)-monophosphatase